MRGATIPADLNVNCRIGSLEKEVKDKTIITAVNCRIGSLEIISLFLSKSISVNCRIGSLENTRYR